VNPKIDSKTSEKTALAPRRFRIDKLEERIAPKKGGKGTNNCPLSGTCTAFCSSY
jgi:hypothetical protein